MSTKISWTDETWNPIIGCQQISEGCKNCYAEKMAKRLCAMGKEQYFPVVDPHGWTGKTNFVESQLEKPLKWKKPRMIFVCSMGDLFHKSVDFQDIIEIFLIMKKCPQHTFQILTKRPDIMRDFFEYAPNPYWGNLPNVWLGVTAENQEQANRRIPVLLKIPAKVRFVSVEPMLSEVIIKDIDKLDWIICGGESGHNARPMHPDWARSLKDQCESANVPFFFKQWGEWVDEFHAEAHDGYKINGCFIELTEYGNDYKGIYMYRVGKKLAGTLIDGKEYKQFPKIKI